MTHDPVTLTVIESALAAAADEMFAILRKTAMSPIIYEVLDCGTGITDAQGRLVSSGAGIPTFVGALDKAVTHILARHGDTIRDGDLFLTNDPYDGGVTHLNDLVVAPPHLPRRPPRRMGRLDGASQRHRRPHPRLDGHRRHRDLGRRPAHPRDPPFRRRPTDPQVLDILTVNSRQPELLQGDLWAQVAAAAAPQPASPPPCRATVAPPSTPP